jgi:hypothetical protein
MISPDHKSIAQVLLPLHGAIETGYQETADVPAPAVFDSGRRSIALTR